MASSNRVHISERLLKEEKLEPAYIAEFIDRLDDSYFGAVPEEEILRDAVELSHVTEPGEIRFRAEEHDGSITCIIYAYDFPGLLSLLCGILGVTGFDIRSGTIHTYRRATEVRDVRQNRHGRVRRIRQEHQIPRKIIDRFTGVLTRDITFGGWVERTRSQLETVWSHIDTEAAGPTEGITAARSYVYEAVSRVLAENRIELDRALYPVSISVSEAPRDGVRLTVLSNDTPFFLFALGTALALQDVSIESVRIRTHGDQIEDEIDIYDIRGDALTDTERIDRIQFSVLLTKQFTYFLGGAPDPVAALRRFETLCDNMLGKASASTLGRMLSNPDVLQDLARVLGTSDFLWEEFVRLQYETLLPMLERSSHMADMSHSPETLETLLNEALENASTFDEKRKVMNDFKNTETYLIDVDHIINPNLDFFFLSSRLTRLAEVIVSYAVAIAYDELVERHGTPTGFAGLPVAYAVMGLGKFGGAALGYASDIELIYIYSDAGETNGEDPISNADFFERCFKNATNSIEAKQEGIFKIDLRLRPHGSGGPVAVSVDSFCDYYGASGAALSYEKLALVRMRAVAGDEELGKRIERLRDEMIYATDSIDLSQLMDLRKRQFEEKNVPGRLNAKFSPGALVDLEYSVQILQCRFGKDHLAFRTPRIHKALEELVRAGYLESEEEHQLVESYRFLRNLINGLRMLRGSAKDLFLPDPDSVEYSHLARRMGYTDDGEMSASRRLHIEFEVRTAVVRHFVESRLGPGSLPGGIAGNAADLVLSDDMDEDRRTSILESAGFRNVRRADTIIRSLREDADSRQAFARLAVLAFDLLGRLPEPDMALNNWHRFTGAVPSAEAHFRHLLEQPLMLRVLLQLFSISQFLSDTLVANPSFLDWIADPNRLHRIRNGEELRHDIDAEPAPRSRSEWMTRIRDIRRREILRIGTRDFLGVPLAELTTELTIVADTIIQAALSYAWAGTFRDIEPADLGFCVFAFGKLGGRELNYSSDIDILATYDSRRRHDGREPTQQELSAVVELMRELLSDYAAGGYVYRVDLRLRPYGRAGLLVPAASAIVEYYRTDASLWERQALLKLRPIAGDIAGGTGLLEELRSAAFARIDSAEVRREIARLRAEAIQTHASMLRGKDVKNGAGGIRDIEFMIQGIQLEHAADRPKLVTGNTLEAIVRLEQDGLLPLADAAELREDYIYLRRLEHLLQLLEDRQVHTLPKKREEIEVLSKRLHGTDSDVDRFLERIDATLDRVRAKFRNYLEG